MAVIDMIGNGVIILTLLFAVFTIPMVWKDVNKIYREFYSFISMQNKEMNFKVRRMEVLKSLESTELLKEVMKPYKRALIGAETGKVLALDNYMAFESIMSFYGNRKLASLVPGTLTALGIFGTFAGLTYGLKGIDTSTVQATQASVNQLLAGISAAFNTSLVGISASVFWNVYDKHRQDSLKKKFHQLVASFNDTNEVEIVGDPESEVLDLLAEQALYMRTFAEDISIKLSEQLSASINEAITPHFESMRASNEMLVESINENKLEGIDKVATELVEQVNAMFGNQFDNMGETLKGILEWQTEVHKGMGDLVEQIMLLANNQMSINKSSSSLMELIDDYLIRVNAVTENIIVVMNDMNSVSGMIGHQLELYESHKQGLTDVANLTMTSISSMDQLTKLIQGDTQALNQHFQMINTTLTDSSEQFANSLNKGLEHTFGQFDDNLSTVTRHLDTVIKGIRNHIEDLPDLIEQLNQQVSKFSETFQTTTNQEIQ